MCCVYNQLFKVKEIQSALTSDGYLEDTVTENCRRIRDFGPDIDY
jgi:hypothetical protein